MQAYFIATDTDRQDLAAAIATRFGENSRKVAPGQWLVSANLTPKELSDALDASNGKFGKFIVVLIASYFGWHDKDMWDWLALKRSTT